VGRSEHEFFAIEGFEVTGQVVDHIVAMHDDLAAAEHDLLPGEKREMLMQPLLFFAQGLRKLHGCRYDEQRIFAIELLKDFLAVFVGYHLPEKSMLVGIAVHGFVVIGKAEAVGLMAQAVACDTHTKITFILFDKLAGGVGNDVIHIYDQAFHVKN
jgi:hypothetical protein